LVLRGCDMRFPSYSLVISYQFTISTNRYTERFTT
jgi:hypothetical protein